MFLKPLLIVVAGGVAILLFCSMSSPEAGGSVGWCAHPWQIVRIWFYLVVVFDFCLHHEQYKSRSEAWSPMDEKAIPARKILYLLFAVLLGGLVLYDISNTFDWMRLIS